MSLVRERYKELLSLTQLYLLREYVLKERKLIDGNAFSYPLKTPSSLAQVYPNRAQTLNLTVPKSRGWTIVSQSIFLILTHLRSSNRGNFRTGPNPSLSPLGV